MVKYHCFMHEGAGSPCGREIAKRITSKGPPPPQTPGGTQGWKPSGAFLVAADRLDVFDYDGLNYGDLSPFMPDERKQTDGLATEMASQLIKIR